MSIQFLSRCVLTTVLVFAATPELWAQVGLQITIGSYGQYGGPFGATPFGVGPVGPGFYGVGPSLGFTARGRGILSSPYYSDYRGYSYYVPAQTALGIYGYPPYATPRSISPSDYPYAGTGPYSGANSNGMNSNLDYNNNYSRNNYHNYYNDYYQSQSAIRPQSGYAPRSPIVSPDTPDLRPGMVLPDGSTVISVGQPGEKQSNSNSRSSQGTAQSVPQPPTAQLPTPPPPTPLPPKSGRAAF